MPGDANECEQCRGALPPGARFCPACGAPAAERAAPQAAPVGERRQVAILFADLAGYTRMSSGLDAEEVHRILTRYFELADGAIEHAGGTIDKHVGDAVMGVFGAPVAHGNDIERALRAALDIHAGMAALAADVGRSLAAHVGVASGEVVAAATGSDAHRPYTVTGDAVNLAARLTDLAAAGETTISDDVYRAVAARVDVVAVGEVAIRGLATRQRLWKLRALRTPGGARAPLVGREVERRRFEALLADAAATRSGAVVQLVAEPGMGKSRLAEAFMATALAQGAYGHAATVLDFGAGKGEDAIHALLCSLLDVPPHGDAAMRRDAFTQALAQQRAGGDHALYLADLLVVRHDADDVYDAMDNDARQRGKREALADVVERAAAQAPCLLLVEDVHWASPWVLACLQTIAASVERHPIVLLMTTRREGAALATPWPAGHTTRFDLAPLAAKEALALARIHFATSPDLAQRCVDRAQGNPLFLVQLLRSGTDDDAVPASIQSVVLARLDRLPPADKRAMQAAAVIGQRFDLDVLRALTGDAAYDATGLIERDLVRVDEREPGMLAFAHALIRDGAYASLLHSVRRDFHRAAARWFEGRDATLRAQHLDRAEDAGAPAAYLEAARAEAAAMRYDAALALAQRGTALDASPAMRYALSTLEGELLRALGRGAASIAAFEGALAFAADDRERCAAWIGVASGHRDTSATEAGLAALDQAALHAGEPRESAYIHYLRGSLRFAQGDVARCASEHQRALALAQEAGDRELEARAQSGIADALYAQGRMISARAAFQRCVDVCAEEGLAQFAVVNRCMIGIVDALQGLPYDGLAVLAEARGVAHALRNRVAETMAYETEGMLLLMCGRYDRARETLPLGLALARETGARRFEAIILSDLAWVTLHYGDREAARLQAQAAWQICSEVGPRFSGPIALAVLAATAASAAERDRALADAERLLEAGCIAHCHLDFYAQAIDLALGAHAWAEAERYAACLEAFTRPEPLPYCDLLVSRGRALAAAGRGRADRDALEDCRRRAVAMRVAPLMPALDAALAALES
ncbi:MAG: adenylate/guanylate cyclase domain-containing protein [Casimicrobiaceae bacterium]